MRKLLLFFFALLTGVSGAWAEVTMPTKTTNVDSPNYYTIKNYRSGKYAAYAGPSTQLAQVASITMESLWFFVENEDGVYIVPAVDPTVKLVTNASANATGAKWYLVENPHQSGYFCVSLTSGATANCWDDNGSHTGVGYWQPSASDHEGTSWTIEASSTTLAEVIDYRRNQILPTINALPEVLRPSAKMTALNSAATDADFRAAVANFSANVTFLCRSGKYLEIGDTQGTISSTTKTNNSIIQLESVGDGSFYLKGYMSMKYMGDVEVSTAIKTEASANTPYYIQTVTVDDVKYAVARPTKWADSGWSNGYHYIHNGGSGCVGWESAGTNTQFTIEEVSLPDGYASVTYNIELDDAVIVSETVRQATGTTSAVPSKYINDYTSYAYDVTTIPDASSATITATATVSDLPFTASTNYEGATWYYMQLHTTWGNHISTNDDAISWASGSSSSDKYYWAFMGNPIQGFKIINRATGSSKYLAKTNPATMSATATEWNIKKKKATHFGLWNENVNQYANGQSSTIKYWGSFDAGSTFWVTEVSADEINFVDDIAELETYDYGNNLGQYSFTGEFAGYHGNEATIISGLKSAGYSSENLTNAENFLAATAINQPTGKFVRLYNPADARYWGISATSNYTTTESDIAKAGIFYVDGDHILNYQNGLYTANSATALTAAVGNTGGTFTFSESATRGKYYVNNGGYQVSWQNAANGFHINRLGTLSDSNKPYGTWELKEVTSLPVTISAAGYATLNSPVALTIPTGVTAYTGTINGEYLTLNELTDKIPANTAVVLAGSAGDYTFDITTADAFAGTNNLSGTTAAIAWTSGNYTLQKSDSDETVGFYGDEPSPSVIPGFKAYLASASGVKGFEFDLGTAVKAIEAAQNPGKTVYDMNGRRVENPAKGLYIVNGKKVIIK